MTGAKKIWIAKHPELATGYEFSITKPQESGVFIESYLESVSGRWCEWVECVVIPIDGEL